VLRPEATLNPRSLRRESIQLGLLAVGSLAVALFTGRVVQLIGGVVDVFVFLLTTIAAIVAWRVGGRGAALGLYVVAALAFLVLAVANIAG
jgi:hypothetical protein